MLDTIVMFGTFHVRSLKCELGDIAAVHVLKSRHINYVVEYPVGDQYIRN